MDQMLHGVLKLFVYIQSVPCVISTHFQTKQSVRIGPALIELFTNGSQNFHYSFKQLEP